MTLDDGMMAVDTYRPQNHIPKSAARIARSAGAAGRRVGPRRRRRHELVGSGGRHRPAFLVHKEARLGILELALPGKVLLQRCQESAASCACCTELEGSEVQWQ
eukprot:COSAG03_NODE_1431_length_4089_cov_65.356892_6_plen_104_part_00